MLMYGQGGIRIIIENQDVTVSVGKHGANLSYVVEKMRRHDGTEADRTYRCRIDPGLQLTPELLGSAIYGELLTSMSLSQLHIGNFGFDFRGALDQIAHRHNLSPNSITAIECLGRRDCRCLRECSDTYYENAARRDFLTEIGSPCTSLPSLRKQEAEMSAREVDATGAELSKIQRQLTDLRLEIKRRERAERVPGAAQ